MIVTVRYCTFYGHVIHFPDASIYIINQDLRIQVFTWKPDVQPSLNLNLKGSLENNSTVVTSK
jgi:hypothetical protein